MTQHLLKNSFLRGVLFLLLCVVGIGNAWGEEVTFKLHTGEVTDGYYIIVSNGVAMNNQTSKNRLQYDDVTISNDIIQAESNARYVWYISSEGNGTYTIKNANNNYYVASTGTKQPREIQLLMIKTNGTSQITKRHGVLKMYTTRQIVLIIPFAETTHMDLHAMLHQQVLVQYFTKRQKHLQRL